MSKEVHLTPREQEILFYWCQDLTNKDISTLLFISKHTFAAHIQNIYTKLGVTKRHLAVLKAIELGIYSNNDIENYHRE